MQKTLKNLKMSIAYDSDKDDILNDFYIPALTVSSKYKRIAGYFSSSAFALAARGLAKFIINGGHMQLIVNHVLQSEDKNILEVVVRNPSKLDSILLNQMDMWDLENQLIRDHVEALGWMLANNLLELKIAISNKESVFHQKVGILEDFENNKISFSGSNNESSSGWKNNIEEFKVFRGWVSEQNKYVEADIAKFSSFWNNLSRRAIVLDIPNAIRRKIIEIAPKRMEDINIDTELTIHNFEHMSVQSISSERKIELMDFQKEAIKSWIKNDYKGILEMATGTGKTLTALGAVKRIYDKYKKYCVIIAVPYKHLVSQWMDDIKTELDYDVIIEAHSDIRGWQTKLTNFISDYDDGFISKVVIVAVYDTLSSDNFNKIITKTRNDNVYMLIADEVHNLGAPQNSNGMFSNIKMRLGLSATPARWFDEDGTQKLNDYFSKTVYVYDLKMAIDDNRLTPYDYYPHFVSMTPDEFEEYVELSKRIIKSFNINKDNDDYLKLLLLKRSKIVKNSEAKLEEFTKILKSMKIDGNVEHLLIYCDSGEQLNKAQQIINEFGIVNHKFTQIETIEERKQILSQFDNEVYSCLVAMKCLDEGVNVPSTRTAIILASSTNPREYIQRRGRVLRKYPGKEKAVIHDFVVLPPERIDDPALLQIEQQILKKELNRTQEFLETASNKAYIITSLSNIMLKYHVYLD